MTYHSLLTRRILIRDMGKAGLAVMILGTAACSSEQTAASTSTTASAATSLAPPTSTTTTPTTTESPSSDAGWQRVQLEFVSAYILFRGGEAAVVDTGVGGSAPDIEAGLRGIGLEWGAVGHVILTHRHPDHQGSLAAVVEASGGAPWYAGDGDISGISATTVGTPVGDGDSVFDLDIIETPGHTPGHISVLDAAGGVLVAGDAMNGADGTVTGANPSFSENMDLANASVQKLASFDYEVVLFGHGDPVVTGASDAVKELAASL
ncbi:MAG: MBL fold metallo-hydrolase [Actinomycetota bacterium]|nr:MBL fold metallo-hydrolase [Actinomycetota bacterium]